MVSKILRCISTVRYHTRPCIRRLIRFGSGEAGIAAMAQAISQQRSGCSAVAGTMPCGNEHTNIEFERCINKISLTLVRNKFGTSLKCCHDGPMRTNAGITLIYF